MPEQTVASAPVDTPVVEVSPVDVEDDKTAGNENIVEGPTVDVSGVNEKKMKVIVKEGGKRGVEIEGAADMGGLQFFCTMMGEVTEGKLPLLVESMKAMNAISDPTEEERKGGAGKLGKMIFSYKEDVKTGTQSIAAVAYVPKDKASECPAKEWLADVVLNLTNSASFGEENIKTWEDQSISTGNWAGIEIQSNSEKNLFPIKMRDPAISMAYNFLKKRGLFPEDDDEDDDEYVFGDEDFP